MEAGRLIELIEIEQECVGRKANGDCDSDCRHCDLVQDDMELDEMYEDLKGLVKKSVPMEVRLDSNSEIRVGYCPACGMRVQPFWAEYCCDCGQALLWRVLGESRGEW